MVTHTAPRSFFTDGDNEPSAAGLDLYQWLLIRKIAANVIVNLSFFLTNRSFSKHLAFLFQKRIRRQ
jgi:hypothetical protein